MNKETIDSVNQLLKKNHDIAMRTVYTLISQMSPLETYTVLEEIRCVHDILMIQANGKCFKVDSTCLSDDGIYLKCNPNQHSESLKEAYRIIKEFKYIESRLEILSCEELSKLMRKALVDLKMFLLIDPKDVPND